MKPKVIVTGSAGFLGSHLVKRLKSSGYKVIEWDLKNGHDVCNPNLTAKDVDLVFHLACPVDPENYRKVAFNTLFASSNGTVNMINIALKNKAKFIYVSSSEVYGEPYTHPYDESDLVHIDPLNERSYYSVAKLMGETITSLFMLYYNLEATIVRPFNIYGPGMRKDDNRVIPSFMRNIKKGKPVQIAGDGSAVRTFCYIDDFIEGLIGATFSTVTNREVFNLGSKETITMTALAKVMGAEIEYIEARKGEQHYRKPNIAKADRMLNWKPTTPLKQGLEKMWQSYP